MTTILPTALPVTADAPCTPEPASAVESLLAGLWTDILSLEHVDAGADFLALAAGDPYDVATLVSRLCQLGFQIHPATVLAHPRLRDLAKVLGRCTVPSAASGAGMPLGVSRNEDSACEPAGARARASDSGPVATTLRASTAMRTPTPTPTPTSTPTSTPISQPLAEPTRPFRFTAELPGAHASGESTVETAVVDLGLSVSAVIDADDHQAPHHAVTLHLALALALSRCSGQSTVFFASAAGAAWRPVVVDLAANSVCAAASSISEQLARPPQTSLDDTGLPFAPVVGLRITPALAAAGRRVDVEHAPVPAVIMPAVIIDAARSTEGWTLSATGHPTAQPRRLLDYLGCALARLPANATAAPAASAASSASAAPAAPAAPAVALDVMPEAERRQLDRFAQGPGRNGHGGPSIGAWFERQARATPDAMALVCGETRLSYAELDDRAARLGGWLRRRGAAHGDRIGLCVARGVDMVVAQLAILKLGAAYVPLDPSFPRERLAFMAGDADLALLVSDSRSIDILPWPPERTVLVDRDRRAIEGCDPLVSGSVTDVSSGSGNVEDAPTGRGTIDIVPAGGGKGAGIRADDPAYLIYTSGSTGKPKGVVVTHGNVTNFIDAIQARPGLRASDRLLAVTTLSFDIHVLELLAPLCSGACVVLADTVEASSGPALQDLIARHRVTMLQATPSTWHLMLDAGWNGTPGLVGLIGGEALSRELAHQLLPRTAALWNLYGPTEATVWSHVWQVDDRATEMAIGTPLANVTGRVIDAAGRLCPIGVAGELWIGGAGVAAGYWHRDALTQERFLPDPSCPGGRVYRTGDLVCWLEQGDVRHLGRMDHQVKLRGHRIELGEIEAAIEASPAVAECLCVVRPDPGGEPRLVAYARCGAPLDVSALLADIARVLPDYMVPAHVVALASLPLLPNGKVDRSALPDPVWTVHAGSDRDAPGGPVETALAAIWAEVLKLDRIGRHDNFFELGGHSLTAMRVMTRVEKRFGRTLRLASLFEAPTLAAQAQLIAAVVLPGSTARSAVVPIQRRGARPPIFFVSGYGGPILLLQNLARELGPDQPLFLLDFAALTGAGESDTLEAAATALIGHLRAWQPNGPYHLAGYSLGAPVVYEMGQQLLAAGQQVPMLAMLDRFAPGHPHSPSFLRRILLHLRASCRRGPRGAAAYLGFFAARLARRLARRIGLPVAAHQRGEDLEVVTLNLDPATVGLGRASDHYVFRPYPGPLMFIRVADLSDRAIGTVEPDPVGGWLELAPAARPIGMVPGTHTTLLFPEHARQVAGLLVRCMEMARNDVASAAEPGKSPPDLPRGLPHGEPASATAEPQDVVV